MSNQQKLRKNFFISKNSIKNSKNTINIISSILDKKKISIDEKTISNKNIETSTTYEFYACYYEKRENFFYLSLINKIQYKCENNIYVINNINLIFTQNIDTFINDLKSSYNKYNFYNDLWNIQLNDMN